MKITAIEIEPISQIVKKELAIVSAAGEHPESHYLILSIHTDEGPIGYGEATVSPVWSGENQSTAKTLIANLLSAHLIGKDPLHLNALADVMDRFLNGHPFTKAAIEMALVDVAGKILGVPANVLLGGPRRSPEIPLKFSIGAFTPSEAARVARHALELGLKSVKVKVGFDVPEDITRVKAVRSAVGDHIRVAVDANGGWTESDALRAIPQLEQLNINAIEQPLRRGDFRGCKRLRERTHIPIMLDESIFTRQDAIEAIRLNACDLISIYPGKNCGILRSMEIAQMAAAAGLQCTIGSNLEMDLGTAAMLHLAVAVPALCASVDHDIIGPLYYERHFVRNPIQIMNGCAIVPGGNGMGMEVDSSA